MKNINDPDKNTQTKSICYLWDQVNIFRGKQKQSMPCINCARHPLILPSWMKILNPQIFIPKKHVIINGHNIWM